MEPVFKKEWIKTSDYPSNFIPAGAEVFVGVDCGSPDGGYTVKGFYDPETGEFHIQECVPNAQAQPRAVANRLQRGVMQRPGGAQTREQKAWTCTDR